jgi:hypothetical protein
MPKQTPRWRALDNRADGGGDTVLVHCLDDGHGAYDVAEVYGNHVKDGEDAPEGDFGVVNARLIAAAPRLLAMLELLYAHCERALVNSDVILTEPGLRISLRQAREALCEASEEWEKA